MPSRVLSIPEKPPLAWLEETPNWYQPGSTLLAMIDGPDQGRVSGIVQPAPQHTAYTPGGLGRNHPQYGIKPPDARYYPDKMATFNHGPIMAVAESGEDVQIKVGRFSLKGDHAHKEIGAGSLSEALPYLHREGQYDETEVAVIGQVSPVMEGPHAGAVMFNGFLAPGSTVADAMFVNSTMVSGENWPSPYHGGHLVLGGVVRCDQSAFPDYSIAASTTDAGSVLFPMPRFVAAAVDVNDPAGALTDLDQRLVKAQADIDALVEAHDKTQESLAALGLDYYNSDGLGNDAIIQGLQAQMAEHEETIAELRDIIEQLRTDNQGADTSPITAPAPAGRPLQG